MSAARPSLLGTAGARMPWRRAAGRAAAVTGVVALLTVAGCTTTPTTDSTKQSGTRMTTATSSPRHRDGGIRTDTAYLVTQFPGLGPITAASWVTGRKGDDRVPGPSGYYLDALVTLDPATVAALQTQPDPSPRPLSQILDADLAALAPQGTLVWPLTLERRVASGSPTYAVTLLLVQGTSTAVLTATSDRPFPIG